MRFSRILLLVVLVAAGAGAMASNASALAFDDQPCPPFNGPNTCPQAQTGKAYSVQLQGRAGTGCVPFVKFTILGGAPPPGITMSSSGLLSGTPTAPGDYLFYVNMADIPPSQGGPSWCSNPKSTQRQFLITVLQGLSIMQRQSTLTPAQLSTAYSLQFSASGGGTLVWSVSSGALPGGLTLNGSTGLLSGTPTTAGDYHFQIKVTDGTRTDVQTYTLSVVPQLKITAPASAAGEVGQPLTVSLSAAGGKGGYTWSLTGGTLPTGVSLDAATGALTGQPTTAGSFPLKLLLTDSSGLTTTVDVNLVVAERLSIAKLRLHAAKAGAFYSARLHAIGGVAPRSWRLLHGPGGLHLNRRTGQLSGTPGKKGTFRVSVQVRDKLGVLAKTTFVLKVG